MRKSVNRVQSVQRFMGDVSDWDRDPPPHKCVTLPYISLQSAPFPDAESEWQYERVRRNDNQTRQPIPVRYVDKDWPRAGRDDTKNRTESWSTPQPVLSGEAVPAFP
jgi:hypothetical protein